MTNTDVNSDAAFDPMAAARKLMGAEKSTPLEEIVNESGQNDETIGIVDVAVEVPLDSENEVVILDEDELLEASEERHTIGLVNGSWSIRSLDTKKKSSKIWKLEFPLMTWKTRFMKLSFQWKMSWSLKMVEK